MSQGLKNSSYIQWLRGRLKQELPGWKTQSKLLPIRDYPNWDEIWTKNPRTAGVLILVYPRMNELHIAFTKRHEYAGVHSNQISLPGGKKEGEESYEETALRETEEEIGVSSTRIELIGSLSRLYIPPSNFVVYPQVGIFETEPIFIPEEAEVKEILEVPVSQFTSYEMVDEVEIFVRGQARKLPAFNVKGEVIWGATAMIMSEFVNLHQDQNTTQ